MTTIQSKCAWPHCDRPIRYKKDRLCAAHYQRQRDGRDMDAPFKGSGRTCTWPNCDRPYGAKGLCQGHYHRQIHGRDMDAPFAAPRTCSHPECNRPHSARGYCSAHYHRKFVLHSDMDAPIRNRRRKDEPERVCRWEECDQLWQGAASGLCPRHERRRKAGRPMDGPRYYRDETGWIDDHGYRHVRRNGKTYREHRLVMEQVLGRPLLRAEEVHHKNGIKSDNTPRNLELWVSWKGQRVTDLLDFVVTHYRDDLLAQLAA